MIRRLIVLAVLAIALVGMAGAANYMYEKASVKGVGYKNVEMIISTQTGFNGQKLVEKESGSGNVITERTELEAERQLNNNGTGIGWAILPRWDCQYQGQSVNANGQPALTAPWTISTSPRKQSSSTCPSPTRLAPTIRNGLRSCACRITGSALCSLRCTPMLSTCKRPLRSRQEDTASLATNDPSKPSCLFRWLPSLLHRRTGGKSEQ